MSDQPPAPPSIGTNMPDARAQLKAHFEAGSHEQHPELWDALWAKGDFIPWDKGFPNPALVDTLVQRTDLVGASPQHSNGKRRKRVLIPGCGKGYDVLLFASFGYDAYGLEVSENALKAAKELAASEGDKYPARSADVGAGSVAYVSGDFFKDGWVNQVCGGDGQGFDIIYDYTVSGPEDCGMGHTNRPLHSFSLLCHQRCARPGQGVWRSCSLRTAG